MSERKPCPFCGFTDLVYMANEVPGVFKAACGRCAAEGPYEGTEDAAWKMWNDRPTSTPQPGWAAEIERLRGLLEGQGLCAVCGHDTEAPDGCETACVCTGDDDDS